MATVAVLYKQPSKHDVKKLLRGAEQVRYLAGFYELSGLGAELRRQAAQVGWEDLDQQLGISDAGNGLEDFFPVNFPRAERMLDFYHASEHVAPLAQSVHPHAAAAATEQTKKWCHTLKHDGGPAVVAVELQRFYVPRRSLDIHGNCGIGLNGRVSTANAGHKNHQQQGCQATNVPPFPMASTRTIAAADNHFLIRSPASGD